MLINEVISRSRSYIYHVSTFLQAAKILKSNVLKGYNRGGTIHVPGSVSFTLDRNYNVLTNWYDSLPGIRFKFDYKKLSAKYEIELFNDDLWDQEEEEVIIKGNITNLNDYIVEILVVKHPHKNKYEQYKDFLEYCVEQFEYGMKYNEYNDSKNYIRKKYDKEFNKSIRMRGNWYDKDFEYYASTDNLYIAIMTIKYLINHPKMNKKDAVALEKIVTPYIKFFNDVRSGKYYVD